MKRRQLRMDSKHAVEAREAFLSNHKMQNSFFWLLFVSFAMSTTHILSLKEGHSAEKFDAIVAELVSAGATVKQKYDIIHGVVVDVPDNVIGILSNFRDEIDIEKDETVHALENDVSILPTIMQQAGFGP